VKQKTIGILAIAIILGSVAAVQATVTLSTKTPASADKVVILMFNDGWLSTYTNALPILESYGYKASFAIYPKAQDGKYSDYMSWAQVEALSKAGYDVESHTYSHLVLTGVSASILQSELVNSKQVLQQHGIQAGALIYPEGENPNDATVKQAMKNAGYLIAGGTNEGIIDVSNIPDYYAIPAYSITDTTSLAYFESLLYGVSGSNVAMLVYQKVSDTTVDSDTVSIETFQQQMTYLHDNGFTVKTLSDVFFDITPLPTATPTPVPTATPTPIPTPVPTPTPTPVPTATPTPTASPSPTPTPTASPTPTPTITPTPNPTATPSPAPTITPTPTPQPTQTTVPTPTATPTATATPTTQPTTSPTASPSLTSSPTTTPTTAPTTSLTTPSPNPIVTETPTPMPTVTPTTNPTSANDTSAPQSSNEISSGTALAIVGCSAVSVLAVAILVRMYAAKRVRLGITKHR
jgi:peptidoglycan/xylan/chitin deacetylase (PgdA/CDA1 family)